MTMGYLKMPIRKPLGEGYAPQRLFRPFIITFSKPKLI